MEFLSFDDDTKGGITLLMYGLFGYFITEGISALEYANLSQNISEGSIPQTGAGSSCLTGLIGLISFMLLVIGAYKIYKGSDDLSNDHQKKVKFGGISLIVGFFGGLLSGAALLSRDPSEITMAGLESIFANLSIVGAFTGILLMGGILLLVYELGSDKQKKYMLGVIGLYIVMRIGLAVMNQSLPGGDEYEMVSAMMERLAIANGLESLFSLGFAGIYFMVKDNYLRNRREETSSEPRLPQELYYDFTFEEDDLEFSIVEEGSEEDEVEAEVIVDGREEG